MPRLGLGRVGRIVLPAIVGLGLRVGCGRRAGSARGRAPLDGAGPGRDLGPAGRAELGEDVLHVAARRLGRDAERFRDLGVGQALRDRAWRPRIREPSAVATARHRRSGPALSGRARRRERAATDSAGAWRCRGPGRPVRPRPANRFERASAVARSSRAQVASQMRPRRCQPATAASRQVRATPVEPAASETRPWPCSSAGWAKAGAGARCSVHAASQRSASLGRPAAW